MLTTSSTQKNKANKNTSSGVEEKENYNVTNTATFEDGVENSESLGSKRVDFRPIVSRMYIILLLVSLIVFVYLEYRGFGVVMQVNILCHRNKSCMPLLVYFEKLKRAFLLNQFFGTSLTSPMFAMIVSLIDILLGCLIAVGYFPRSYRAIKQGIVVIYPPRSRQEILKRVGIMAAWMGKFKALLELYAQVFNSDSFYRPVLALFLFFFITSLENNIMKRLFEFKDKTIPPHIVYMGDERSLTDSPLEKIRDDGTMERVNLGAELKKKNQ